MKNVTQTLTFFVIVITIILSSADIGAGQITPGQMAPHFSLHDVKGATHDLSDIKKQSMVILYFLDIESRPSQEGLLNLDQLAQQYKDSELSVLAITQTSKDKVEHFIGKTNIQVPVLLDTSNVSTLYNATVILPTVYILGPELLVIDYFQGGGKTTEVMLVRLAETQLQRKKTVFAKAISQQVTKKNPHNVKAQAVNGYAALQEGDFKGAEKIFEDLSDVDSKGEILGKEGLVALYAKKGDSEKALMLAQEVEKKAPERAYVHVVKADLLYSKGKKKEAEEKYQEAITKSEAESYQKAVAYNQFGRFKASLGKYQSARELYDHAVAIDPYYIEATSNKGITYEKEGKWDQALNTYRKALTLDKNDTFAAILAKKAEEMLSLQKDIAQKKRIDTLVKELVTRYHDQKKSTLKSEDTWSSRPMILSFIDLQEKGGLAERDGLSIVLTTQLAAHLNASGRVQVIERAIVEQLLEELNIGSSDLANPETALKLGNVLAAKIIGTGSLVYMSDGTLLSLRLIDTETSAIPKIINKHISPRASLEKELYQLNRDILKTIIMKYPLQGYVVQSAGDQIMINLGQKQGVVLGTKFDVLEEQKPISYKGKLLHSSPKSIAEIEVIQVEQDLCYTKIVKQERPPKKDDKIQEKITEIVTREGNNVSE